MFLFQCRRIKNSRLIMSTCVTEENIQQQRKQKKWKHKADQDQDGVGKIGKSRIFKYEKYSCFVLFLPSTSSKHIMYL